jgi:hypothetical protein
VSQPAALDIDATEFRWTFDAMLEQFSREVPDFDLLARSRSSGSQRCSPLHAASCDG